MEILLIRHGQPQWRKDGLVVRNPELTELGHQQARLVAEALRHEHLDEVWCSPLIRARQTAEPVFATLGRDERVADWLEEMRDPDYDGQPGHFMDEMYLHGRRRPASDHWHGLPGGESMSEFVSRIRVGAEAFFGERGIRRIHDDLPVWEIPDPDARIALIAHGGTNAVTICHLLGVEATPWEWERFFLEHASITRITPVPLGEGHMFSLRRLSGVEHLPPGMRSH